MSEPPQPGSPAGERIVPLGAPTDPLRPTGRVRAGDGQLWTVEERAAHDLAEARREADAGRGSLDGLGKGLVVLLALVALAAALALLGIFAALGRL